MNGRRPFALAPYRREAGEEQDPASFPEKPLPEQTSLWDDPAPAGRGQLSVEGIVKYEDRDSSNVAAEDFYVALYNTTTQQYLTSDVTGNVGDFTLGPVTNPGTDNVTLRVSAAVNYPTGGEADKVWILYRFSGNTWKTFIYTFLLGTLDDGEEDVDILTVDEDQWEDTFAACWIKDDLSDGYLFAPDQTGSYKARWDYDWSENLTGNTFNPTSGYMNIWHDGALNTGDPVLHEMGHNVMWNVYGSENWPQGTSSNHTFVSVETQPIAWKDGWASFWALAVTDDPEYHFNSGASQNLETPTWGTSGWPNGDNVIGRVAGALWDIFDDVDDNYPPYYYQYDKYDGGFDDIWDTFYNQCDNTTEEFWEAWKERDHNQPDAVKSIYQNTIKYPITLANSSNFVEGWRMMSLPLDPDPATWAGQFEEIDPLPTFWGFGYYIGETYYAGYKANPTPTLGKGYWVYVDDDYTVDIDGFVAESTDNYSGGSYHLPLVPGWNLIGAPYTFSANWTDILISYDGDNITPYDAHGTLFQNATYWWTGTGYGLGTAAPLNPWKGYWVLAYEPIELLIFPTEFEGMGMRAGGEGEPSDPTGTLGPDPWEWWVQFTADADWGDGFDDDDNYAVMLDSENCSDNYSSFDLVDMGLPMEGMAFYFEAPGANLAQDVKQITQGSKTWDIVVNATNHIMSGGIYDPENPPEVGEITVAWDLTNGPSGNITMNGTITLISPDSSFPDEWPVNMNSYGKLRFEPAITWDQDEEAWMLVATELTFTYTAEQ